MVIMKTETKQCRLSLGAAFLSSLAILFFFAGLSGCSSAPKRPTEIFTERSIAVNQLNLANQTANRGRFEEALLLMEEARRLAVATDDPSLRIKTSIGRGNILFSLGRHTEAFPEWESSAAEGDASGEPELAALARIYTIRAKLVMLANEKNEGGTDADAVAEQYKAQLDREIAIASSDSLITAAGYAALGMAEKQMRRWPQAESAVQKSLDIHERALYFEEAAYDWFLIASIRSMAGNYDPALAALEAAIQFDRRAENGYGLASSWQAMGDVYQKAGRADESHAAYRRAIDIYRAIRLNERAEKLERQLNEAAR